MEWLKQNLEYIQDALEQKEEERPRLWDVVKERLGRDSSFDKRVDQTNQKGTGKASIDYNELEYQKHQMQDKDQNRQEDLEIRHQNPQSTLLFSNNETEKLIANEIAITRAYYDIWKKRGMQRPDTDNFDVNCAKADSLFDVDLKACRSNKHSEIINNIRQVNECFREIAEENPEQFRSALKDAIVRARTLNDWVKNFTTRFNLNEDWVKAGMRQLGINQENFDESYSKFLANPHITKKTFSGQAVSDIVKSYQPDKIVQHYEEFMRANTSLGYINDQLKAGIPVSDIPRRILGREVTQVSGDMNDCLPRALLKGAHPDWSESRLKQCVGQARKHVIEALKMRKEAVYDAENSNVGQGDQLNLGGDAGQILIEYLRSSSPSPLHKVKKSFLDPERPIFTYQYKDGKMQCFEHTPGSPGKQPYAVLRDHYNLQSGHYWAIEDK